MYVKSDFFFGRKEYTGCTHRCIHNHCRSTMHVNRVFFHRWMLIILLNNTDNNDIIYLFAGLDITKEKLAFIKISKCRLKKSNIYLVRFCKIYIFIPNILNIHFDHAAQSGLWWMKKFWNNFVHHCRIKRRIPVYRTVKLVLIIIKIDVTASCIFSNVNRKIFL